MSFTMQIYDNIFISQAIFKKIDRPVNEITQISWRISLYIGTIPYGRYGEVKHWLEPVTDAHYDAL